MKSVQFVFTGRVQGVGFRAATERIASRFDVAGWVRNEPGGDVTCVAQGEPAEIERFLAAVQDVMRAHIEDVLREPAPVDPGLHTFEIRR